MTSPLDAFLDLSHYNPEPQWDRLAASGILAVMLKATQGAGFRDPTFGHRILAAREVGIEIIPYHFLTSADVELQVRNFLAVVDSAEPRVVALDWEVDENQATPEQVEEVGWGLANSFGRAPLLYMGLPRSRPGVATPTMLSWPWWLAEYPLGSRIVGSFADLSDQEFTLSLGWKFWQYTRTGLVDGIAGSVDRSVGNFASKDDFERWLRNG